MITDTIVAVATPPGRGGVGIVRVSGSKACEIARYFLKKKPKPRFAYFSTFKDLNDNVIDAGVLIYFLSPHSFTGEDIVELHGHGNPLILDALVNTVVALGARLARAGEFSERAFLLGKIDLTQAEAIADLIQASTTISARCAMRSLQGELGFIIRSLVNDLIALRIYIEASIDFPEEEIDLLKANQTTEKIQQLLSVLSRIQKNTLQGVRLQEGYTLVLAGEPNAGKSSLLNRLSGEQRAIVSDIPGTTRDVLHAEIQINGIPFHLIDTAGLRESDDSLEQEGVRRAKQAIQKADLILWIADGEIYSAADIPMLVEKVEQQFSGQDLLVLRNKMDKTGEVAGWDLSQKKPCLQLSVQCGDGFDLLLDYLKNKTDINDGEGLFMARRRHLTALNLAQNALRQALVFWEQSFSIELLAEELQIAQQYLNEITGEYTSDDLLGDIFSQFCIGK